MALPNATSPNWHSLLLIDTSDVTSVTRIANIPTTHGLIWGLAFDELGSLYAVTSDSYMLEIDISNGSILWEAPIVDSSGNSISLWDLSSNPQTVPEPSSALLVGIMGAVLLLKRKRNL